MKFRNDETKSMGNEVDESNKKDVEEKNFEARGFSGEGCCTAVVYQKNPFTFLGNCLSNCGSCVNITLNIFPF